MQDDLDKALKMEMIDTSSGVLFPFYDFNTSMIYLAGKVCPGSWGRLSSEHVLCIKTNEFWVYFLF